MPDSTLAERISAYEDDSYDQIFEQLREAAKRELNAEVQQELARLIAVTRRCKNLHYNKDEMDKSDKCTQKWGRPVQELTIAMNALLSKPPKFELAGGAICTAEIQNMRCQGGIPKWLVEKSETSPIMATNIGLLCAFMVWVTLSIVLYYMIMSSGATLQAVQTPLGSIPIVASCAFLGGITSMLMKVNEHARMTRVDLSLLFWTGLFKPFVGLFLGCVLFAIIQTALAGFGGATVPTNDPQKYFYFLIVIGFIAGFSERFAADAITRATPALGGGSGSTH